MTVTHKFPMPTVSSDLTTSAEETGDTHDGWTVVVDERCNDIQLERGAEADASETVERP